MSSNASALAQADAIRLANQQAGDAILSRSIKMKQQVYNQTVVPANNPTISFNPRNVGLIYGFMVKVTATISNTSGSAFNPSDFNVANLISNFTFIDLNNTQRINTSGLHVALVDSIKRRRVFGSSVATDSPIGFGNNWNPIFCGAIATGNSGIVQMYYWIPVSYSDKDFRGSIYGNVLSAQMQLSMTFNAAPIAATATDSTNAVYLSAGAATGSITTATVQVYQYYWDQIPFVNGRPFLPLVDMATIYELKFTNFPASTANVENNFPYSNQRDFLSTIVLYNNNGVARGVGADINYFNLKAANSTEIFRLDPATIAVETRQLLSTDMPKGLYLFDTRERPIATAAYGNMQLNINPITAAAGNYTNVYWEDFAMVNTVGGATSLAG